MDLYDLEKLSREITTSQLKEVKPAALSESAVKIAVKLIISAVSSTRDLQDPKATVRGVCRGVISGIILLGREMVPSSVELIKSMAQLAEAISLDPADMMTWAMEGIAQAAVLGPPDLREQISAALGENFMGIEGIFDDFCRKALERPAS